MKNYDRYRDVTSESYEKKGILFYLCRVPSDKKILPMIAEFKDKKILDVGIGTGYYARRLLENNSVEGVDQNPHLCNIPIKLYQGDASELTRLVGEKKYDIVFSTWMTEYLDEAAIGRFFVESEKALGEHGILVTTVISRWGLGGLYIMLAKLVKKISKFNYHKEQIRAKIKMAGFKEVTITHLDSWLKVPWAYLVIAQK